MKTTASRTIPVSRKAWNRNDIKFLALVSGAGILTFSAFLNSTEFALVGLFAYCIMVIFANEDGTLLHPASVFSAFFAIYSTSFAFRILIDGGKWDPNLTYSINLSLLGLLAFNAITTLFDLTIRNSRVGLSRRRFQSRGNVSAILTLATTMPIVWGSLEVLMIGDLASKRDVVDAGLASLHIARLITTITVAGMLISAWRILNQGRNWLDIAAIIVPISALTLFMLVTGERDGILRALIALVMIYCSVSYKGSGHLVVLIALGAFFLAPVTQISKSILIGGPTQALDANVLFGGEFIAGLRSTFVLVSNGAEQSFEYLTNDIQRALTPLVRTGAISTTEWFNNVYRPSVSLGGTSGWGLGIIAQGYILADALGVVILGAALAVTLSLFYRARNRSIYSLVFYVLLLTVAIYTIRADVANFIAQGLKIGGLSVLLFYVIERAIRIKMRL